MDYFSEFHWWYFLLPFLWIIFKAGSSKGGVVVKRYSAEMDVLDSRFDSSTMSAHYSVFEGTKPHHIDIVIKDLSIPVDDTLSFFINKTKLADVVVKHKLEAEFDHWSDEKTFFPVISGGDELLIKHKNLPVIQGVFN